MCLTLECNDKIIISLLHMIKYIETNEIEEN